MKTTAYLALKDISRDRRIALLVVLLLAFSYINLTFFPAFLNGLSDTFQNEVIDTGTSHIVIQPRAESKQLYLNFESSTRKKIDMVPGIVGSSGHISTTGTLFFRGRQMGARIEALAPSEDTAVTAISQKVIRGDFLTDDDGDDILLGEMVAGRKIEDMIGRQTSFGQNAEGLGGVGVGEKIKVRFSSGVEKEYRVKGIVGSQGFSAVSQTVYMSKKEAGRVLGISDKASSILVRLSDKNSADAYKKLILDLGIANADIRTWKEASTFAEGLNQTFGIVTLVTTLVGIVIVVSTVGIVIFINTSRKRRIIGVLKAIGMQENQVMLVFLAESVIFGIIGTLIGAAFVYFAVFYFNANPIPLPVGFLKPVLLTETVATSITILIVSSAAAGYVPARLASRQEILETIKVVE